MKTPSMSAFPMPPQNRDTYVQPPSMFEFTLPRENKGRFWNRSSGRESEPGQQSVALAREAQVTTGKAQLVDVESRPSTSSRETMLIYDTEFPEKPPMLGFVDVPDLPVVGRKAEVVDGGSELEKTNQGSEKNQNGGAEGQRNEDGEWIGAAFRVEFAL